MEGNEGQDVRTFIPRRTLRAATTYRFESMPHLKVGASVNWQSHIHIQDAVALVRQGSYATVGLMARYEVNPHFAISANVNNATDKTYLKSLYWNQSFYASPRNASVNLNWIY
jgi:outer membrane receptor for ferric coprogen and ferric-rhodotorulic acid